jgi:hypothetical protein
MEREDLHKIYNPEGKFNSASKFLLPSLKLHTRLDWQNLKLMGFVGVFIYDYTENKVKYYKNSLLLIFNPSKTFKETHWNNFSKVIKSYPNLLEYIEYSTYVYGFWMKIGGVSEDFGVNLRYLFKQGKFSEFPTVYVEKYLEGAEQKVCKKDENYQYGLEKNLLLEHGDLNGMELESIPDRETYIFNFKQ